jgi:hypothetical protein
VVTAAAAGKACRDAVASELRSMINGYRIDSHRVFPFIQRRRHPPNNSQYAFKAAVLGQTASGGLADARVEGITVERAASLARRAGADVCNRSRSTVLNWAGATLAGAAALGLDPLSLRLMEALAKNGMVDLGTGDIAISRDQRKLITDGHDLEAKSVSGLLVSPAGGPAKTTENLVNCPVIGFTNE